MRLLGIGLPLTILAGVFVGIVIFTGLPFWQAAILATILAPTDAALAQAVINSERVPGRIREALNVESGLNDGICFPILIQAILPDKMHSSRCWPVQEQANILERRQNQFLPALVLRIAFEIVSIASS